MPKMPVSVEAEYTGVVGGPLVQNQDVFQREQLIWQVVTKSATD